jgi:uncharacterized protein YbjT (DUF2867 family)
LSDKTSRPESQAETVLVTGGTGNVGSSLLKELHGSGLHVIAAASCEESNSTLSSLGDSRLCSYDNPSQMDLALEGINAVFLMVPFNEKMLTWGEQFVEQARQAGVQFIVRLSGLAAEPDGESKMGQLHAQIDEAVKRSGISWCILRCNSFMQNFSGLYRGMIRHGLLSLPEGDARSAFIDTRDISSVVAHILINPEPHHNHVYDLSGAEALSNTEAAEIISEVTGISLRYLAISEEETRMTYQKMGISPWRIEVLESLSRYICKGNARFATDTVENLLGRPPRSFRKFAEDHRQFWIE